MTEQIDITDKIGDVSIWLEGDPERDAGRIVVYANITGNVIAVNLLSPELWRDACSKFHADLESEGLL